MRIFKVVICLMGVLTSSAVADAPSISNVQVRQRWPWSRLVDISYVLNCGPSERVDVTLTAKNGSVGLRLPPESLSGDNLYGLSQGTYHMVWDPMKAGYTNAVLTQFSVDFTANLVPLYMIVDLTLTARDAAQITYVHEKDLTNGVWGAWVRNPVTNAGSVIDSVIWTGVTESDLYKTDKLVLRRVPAAPSSVGKEMYVGVFEVTQGQWSKVMGSGVTPYFTNATDRALRPMESAQYNEMRGASPTYDWPATESATDPNSFIGKLRGQTAIPGFDLPTMAQWDYACRAGTTTQFNDGETDAKTSGGTVNNNGNTNGYLAALGRYRFNGGFFEDGVTEPNQSSLSEHGTAAVGSYQPNAWGLYDMHGNVFEFCLEWHRKDRDRKKRGGNWDSIASNCRSEAFSAENPASRVKRNGLRLFCVLASTWASAADRIENPYADIAWDKTEYLHSFSHQHGFNPQVFWEMGYGHLPFSNYYPSKPFYPLPDAFTREHPEVISAPNAEQHGLTDSGIHFNAIGSLYTTGYGHTPSIKAGTAPVEHEFTGLHVYDAQAAPWQGIYRLDLKFTTIDEGSAGTAAATLTIDGAERVNWSVFTPIEGGVVRDMPLTEGSAKSFCLKTLSDSIRVKIDFDPASTKITQFRLMQGVNRPWRDAFHSALDGKLKNAQGQPIEGLLYPDAGGITINHPTCGLDAMLTLLDFDQRVLGLEVWNHHIYFGGKLNKPDSMPFYELWDNVLRTGRRCFGFFVKDHFLYGRGRNVLLISDLQALTVPDKEREALRAYRHGKFFGLIGAMSVDASGKVVPPYDNSAFRFTRIAVRYDDSGVPLGVDVAVDGANRTLRPNTQIRFVTDQGIACIENNETAFFAFPRGPGGEILCRYVRAEAFAYPNTHLNGKHLTHEDVAEMNVFQIAHLHDRVGDLSPTQIYARGEEPIGIADMLFAQPILIRR